MEDEKKTYISWSKWTDLEDFQNIYKKETVEVDEESLLSSAIALKKLIELVNKK